MAAEQRPRQRGAAVVTGDDGLPVMDDEFMRLFLKLQGWWCPRCNCAAAPLGATWRYRGTGVAGWCIFCGMDPLTQGPAQPPKELAGLAGLLGAS